MPILQDKINFDLCFKLKKKKTGLEYTVRIQLVCLQLGLLFHTDCILFLFKPLVSGGHAHVSIRLALKSAIPEACAEGTTFGEVSSFFKNSQLFHRTVSERSESSYV